MEFNRLISLVIGFIVLILVFVWVGSRFRSATTAKSGATITATFTPTPTSSKEAGQSWNPFASLFNRNSPTPTVTKTVVQKITNTPTPSQMVIVGKGGTSVTNNSQGQSSAIYKNNKTGEVTTLSNSGITRIPETGASTVVIPLAFSALTLGAYLRKRV